MRADPRGYFGGFDNNHELRLDSHSAQRILSLISGREEEDQARPRPRSNVLSHRRDVRVDVRLRSAAEKEKNPN